jgi:hypothetical protein
MIPLTKTNIALKFDDSFYSQKLKNLPKISQLKPDHPAKRYIESRKIPTEFHSLLRWEPAFMWWVNTLIKGKFDEKALFFDEGRIVIPYFDRQHRLTAVSGRAISDSQQRYINVVLDKDAPLLYGLERVDLTKTVYVVEGQFDSMFLDNCIALSGSNINALTTLAERDKFVIVFDNEPRSQIARKKLEVAINQGYRVVVWPRWIASKDINDMVRGGLSPTYILEVIDNNAFEGISAKIRLEEWSKN